MFVCVGYDFLEIKNMLKSLSQCHRAKRNGMWIKTHVLFIMNTNTTVYVKRQYNLNLRQTIELITTLF